MEMEICPEGSITQPGSQLANQPTTTLVHSLPHTATAATTTTSLAQQQQQEFC